MANPAGALSAWPGFLMVGAASAAAALHHVTANQDRGKGGTPDEERSMSLHPVEVVIVGGGQAGLAMSYSFGRGRKDHEQLLKKSPEICTQAREAPFSAPHPVKPGHTWVFGLVRVAPTNAALYFQ